MQDKEVNASQGLPHALRCWFRGTFRERTGFHPDAIYVRFMGQQTGTVTNFPRKQPAKAITRRETSVRWILPREDGGSIPVQSMCDSWVDQLAQRQIFPRKQPAKAITRRETSVRWILPREDGGSIPVQCICDSWVDKLAQ